MGQGCPKYAQDKSFMLMWAKDDVSIRAAPDSTTYEGAGDYVAAPDAGAPCRAMRCALHNVS